MTPLNTCVDDGLIIMSSLLEAHKLNACRRHLVSRSVGVLQRQLLNVFYRNFILGLFHYEKLQSYFEFHIDQRHKSSYAFTRE